MIESELSFDINSNSNSNDLNINSNDLDILTGGCFNYTSDDIYNIVLKAFGQKKPDIVCFLLENLKNKITKLDMKDKHDRNFLHYFVLYSNYEIINDYLMQILKNTKICSVRDAINKKDVLGNTPLHYAVMMNDTALATLLVNRGANKKIKNNDGEYIDTDEHYASENSARSDRRKRSREISDDFFTVSNIEILKHNPNPDTETFVFEPTSHSETPIKLDNIHDLLHYQSQSRVKSNINSGNTDDKIKTESLSDVHTDDIAATIMRKLRGGELPINNKLSVENEWPIKELSSQPLKEDPPILLNNNDEENNNEVNNDENINTERIIKNLLNTKIEEDFIQKEDVNHLDIKQQGGGRRKSKKIDKNKSKIERQSKIKGKSKIEGQSKIKGKSKIERQSKIKGNRNLITYSEGVYGEPIKTEEEFTEATEKIGLELLKLNSKNNKESDNNETKTEPDKTLEDKTLEDKTLEDKLFLNKTDIDDSSESDKDKDKDKDKSEDKTDENIEVKSELSEMARSIARQSTEIHERAVKKIAEILKLDLNNPDDNKKARYYKAAIWRQITTKHPELSNFDRAVEMEKLVTKDYLKTIDINKITKEIDQYLSDKSEEKTDKKDKKEKKEKKMSRSKSKKNKEKKHKKKHLDSSISISTESTPSYSPTSEF